MSNKRGLPPEINAATVFHYDLEDQAGIGNDMVGNADMSGVAGGSEIDTPVGRGYHFSNDPMKSAASTESSEDLADNWTVYALFKTDASGSSDDPIYRRGYWDGTTTNYNTLIDIRINAGLVTVSWQNSARATISHTFDSYFGYERHCFLAITCTKVTTTRTLRLYSGGVLAETETGLDAAYATSSTSIKSYVGYSEDPDGASFSLTYLQGIIAFVQVNTSVATADEVKDNFRRAIQWDTRTQVYARVGIKDHAGTYVYMEDLADQDWLMGADLTDEVDYNAVGALVKLRKSIYSNFLSKWHDNQLNQSSVDDPSYPGPEDTTYRDPDHASGSTEMLEIGRGVAIDFARVPFDVEPVSTDWENYLTGAVDAVQWESDPIIIRCRDLGGLLIDKYLQVAFDVAEGTLVSVIQVILTKAYDEGWIPSAVTVVEPIASGWVVRAFTQERTPVMTAISNLAAQIGWLCRYDGTELQLYAPERTKVACDGVIDSTDYPKLSRLTIDNSGVRNKVRIVSYTVAAITGLSGDWSGSGGGTAPNGERTPAIVEVKDDDSIAKYGERFCEICEGSVTNISAQAQMETLAANILSDLKDPIASLGLPTLVGKPEIENGDILMIAANLEDMTADIQVAVSSVRHGATNKGSSSAIGLTGRPKGGASRWTSREVRTSGAQNPLSTPDDVNTVRLLRPMMVNQQWLTAYGTQGRGHRNRIPNPGFDRAIFGPTHPPDAWGPVDSPANYFTWADGFMEYNNTDHLSGECCMEFTLDASKRCSLVSKEFFELNESGVFTLRLRAKCTVATRWIVFYLDVHPDRSSASVPVIIKTLTFADTNWVDAEFSINLSADARVGKLRFLTEKAATGIIYLDSVMGTMGRPQFRVGMSADQTVTTKSSETIEFDDEQYDWSGGFSDSTFIFTAPIAGYYDFSLYARMADDTIAITAYLVGDGPVTLAAAKGTGMQTVELKGFWMDAGDTITPKLYNDEGTDEDIDATSTFSGRMVRVD